MFNEILTNFTEALKSAGEAIVSFFASIVSIFYTSDTGLTFYGILLLIFIGVSILFFGINYVLSLIGVGDDDD